MEKINKICKLIVKLTPVEISQALEMCDQQISYLHPLKIATQRKINEMGRNNKEIVYKIAELQQTIKKNEEPSKTKIKTI